MKKVDQINNKGEIISDFDKKISPAEIKNILSKYMVIKNNKNPYMCVFNKHEFNLCVKQVTYLGKPHLAFKKRIQIPKEWKEYLLQKNTLLLGIYNYKNNIMFVIFDKEKYKHNKLNNSSAHIHTIDLQKAFLYGVFEKTDTRNNKITVIRGDNLQNYLEKILNNKTIELPKEISLFDKFSNSLSKDWSGRMCYKEMFEKSYRNKGQSEWPGFYLEYKFENFLDSNSKLKSICTFVTNKKEGGLDFDLNFNNNYLGDLKAHTNKTHSIPGNDKKSFLKALKTYGKFWYIIFYHSTNKDKDFNYEVTHYWNNLLNKEDKNSYGNKMKNSVTLENMKILEINKYNYKYIVSNMTQGKNSNGNTREMKVKIKDGVVDNFLIYNKKI